MLYPAHSKGKNAEHAVRKILEKQGFQYCIRSYGSKGPVDLLCSNGRGELRAIQVKSAARCYLNEAEKSILIEWSHAFNAKPILASKKKGRWTLQEVETETKAY